MLYAAGGVKRAGRLLRLRTAPPVAGLKDRELHSLKERRLWRLKATTSSVAYLKAEGRSSNEVVLESGRRLMVLKPPRVAVSECLSQHR